MQSRRQLDGLRHGQRCVRLEFIGRHAVDQTVLPRCLDARIVPAIGRNIGERELAHVAASVRVERELRRFARRDRDDRRQLRDRDVENLIHASLVRKHSAAAGALPIRDVALSRFRRSLSQMEFHCMPMLRTLYVQPVRRDVQRELHR